MTKAEDATRKLNTLLVEVRNLKPLNLSQVVGVICMVCMLCFGAYVMWVSCVVLAELEGK